MLALIGGLVASLWQVRDEAKRASLMTETRSWALSVASVVSANPGGTNPGKERLDLFALHGTLELLVWLARAAARLGGRPAPADPGGSGSALRRRLEFPD